MKNLLKALADFQQEVPVIHKGSTAGNGKFTYQYADLPKIFSVINPLLKKHGMGFTQNLVTKEGKTFLNTTIFHVESGEMIDSSCEIPRITIGSMNEYQSFGSGITYFRRYCLASSLCLITDIDNDAEGEQVKTETIKETTPERPKLSVNQFNQLVGHIMNGSQHPKHGTFTVELAKKLYNLSEEQLLTLNDL
ncbi:MAG: ERF family protein [Bacteroidia bacterium]